MTYHKSENGHGDARKKSLIEVVRFGASSLIGFAVDFSAFLLLMKLLGGLGSVAVPVSNVTARVLSASTNFTINRLFVFKDEGNAAKAALRYFLLAVCILVFNTALISVLINVLHWNRTLSKLLTEVTFFTLSWLAQKFLIFRNPKR